MNGLLVLQVQRVLLRIQPYHPIVVLKMKVKGQSLFILDELQAMIYQAWEIQSELNGPLFIRYPKDKTSCDLPEEFSTHRWLTEQNSNSLIVSTGHITSSVQSGLFDHLHLGQIKPYPIQK